MSEQNPTASMLVARARQRFEAAGLADAAVDARVLVAGLLHLSTSDLWLGRDSGVTAQMEHRVDAAIERRLLREPVHRILGHRDFHGIDLVLSAETLEPRADTETLVDAMLPFLQEIVGNKGRANLLDLGTGTGAICLALLKECPQATGTGVDISAGAVATARENAVRNGVAERFSALQSDWFGALHGSFDMIVSNPPYIATAILDGLEPEVRAFDPQRALDGGVDGLDAYRIIARDVASFLNPGGMIGLEIGYDQRVSVTELFQSHGFQLCLAAQDYGQNDRVLAFISAQE